MQNTEYTKHEFPVIILNAGFGLFSPEFWKIMYFNAILLKEIE